MTQTVIHVPASKLSIAPTNVRKTSDPAADAQLKASIAAHGILQNLVGVPVPRRKGEYRITAGGRRLTQLQALIAEGRLDPDILVPVMPIDDKADASEVSLAENFVRLNMSPTDECRAFQHIIATEKKTAADVATRFGLTERFVLGRLRLAGLAEPIFAALGNGSITLDVAKAYASIADTARQAQVFEEMGHGYYANNVGEIRRRLVSGSYRGSDPKALLVGRDAYVAAGGRIECDLFSESGNENWIDSDILDQLADERMRAAADAIRDSEGFGEVRIVCDSRVPYMETYGLDVLDGKAPDMTLEQEERQRAIEIELEAIAGQAGEEGYSDEEARQIQVLEAEYASISEPVPMIADEQKASALAYLVIGHDGQPRLHEQFYAIPAPAVEQCPDGEEADEKQSDDVGETGAATEASTKSPISQRLADELAMMKTELLQVHVASDPHFALDLGTFFMVDAAISHRSFDLPSDLRATAPSPRVHGFESGTAAAESWAALETGLDRSWAGHEAVIDRYDAFCALDETVRAAWLGWAIARTLQAVPAGCSGSAMLDHIGARLGIDVAAWWRPTARTYFDRVSKATILSHFEEIGGTELKSRYGASKKHDLAASAEKLFSGQLIVEAEVRDRAMAWLPDAMRFGPPEAASVEVPANGDPDDAEEAGGQSNDPEDPNADEDGLPQAA
jgi:ParB family chromosome partitioning protein